MKINFNEYDLTEFLIKEGTFCGLPAKLINPNHIGTKFTQRNKIFRSSIWSLDGSLLSGGFYKFVNFSENPENFPVPLTIDNCQFVSKIDGSLTCIDYVNNQISMRTRGTMSIETMLNKTDFEYCLSKYPNIIPWLKENSNYTLLAEITTPNLKIVIDYGKEPDFWLVGAVNKNDYSLMIQSDLDVLAKKLKIQRPEYFSFNSIEELKEKVALFTDKEGCCLYSKNGSEIHKIKAEIYLKLHRFKESATLENTVDLFFEYGCPSYQDFESKLKIQFDYECFELVRSFVSIICDAYKEVKLIVDAMKKFVDKTLKPLSSRKDQAIKVITNFGNTNKASFVFALLDGKSLNSDHEKKLLYQCLKNNS